jgi:hypothetical protein
MASDERGYGSIYGSTWWGSGDAFTNQIGWGSAMFYILDPAAFQQRVLLDGGELEAFECVSKQLRRYPQADDGRLVYEPYAARVIADSGTLEARACTINDINDLKQ